ncbi:MAG TPA: chromosomal replication initiator protein DnaA [Actinomycetota bacterium]|nr:chromosomal replication initiator protein DnaA [Actinomycetota bacterium]
MADEAAELWLRTLASVKDRIGSGGARAWVEGTKAVGLTGDTMVLAAPSAFAKEWLEKRYIAQLGEAMRVVAGREVHLKVTVDPARDDGAGVQLAEEEPPAPPRPAAAALPPALNPRYLFETFVTGPSNRFAHAAAQAVAEQPARSYNPLFIYGGAGLGKTHLLHAIGHEVHRLYPQAQVRYVSSEQFMNEFIRGVREEKMTQFRQRYREADVLLIDDIQFLARGEQTQEEFFHTFNALHNDCKQIVITSDRAPAEIPTLEDRLRTRFEWGLITDVQPPDLETRVAILQKKVAAEGLQISNDVLAFIATRVQNNIRELEGRLIRVVAAASLSRVPITLELAQEVLKPLLPRDGIDEIPSQLIINECAQYFGVSREELIGPGRNRQLVNARQIAMYICRELTPLSLPKIGDAFGNRDHTTVMHADSKIRSLMGERRQVYAQVQELTQRIRSKAANSM